MPGNGPNYTVKIGRISQDAKDVAKNIATALPQILGNLTCWDDITFEHVSQVSLKIDENIDLPIYNYLNKEDVEMYLQIWKSKYSNAEVNLLKFIKFQSQWVAWQY